MRFNRRLGLYVPSYVANDPYTVLHLHCNGTHGSTTIVDSSSYARTPYSVSDASISTAQSVFGGASLYCGGANGVRYSDAAEFNLGTSDFELTFWIRPVTVGADKYVFGQYDGAGNPGFSIGVRLQSATISLSACSGSSTLVNLVSSVPLTVNTWAFFAVTRVGTAFTMVQGSTPGGATTVVATATSSGSINDSPGRLGVGRLGDYGAANVNAYLDEIRFRVGTASSFSTCPSAPF